MKAGQRVLNALQGSCTGLPANGALVLAVSGGVDSMVLLEAAARLAAKNFSSRRLLVAHVNHALRGAESDADEALVRARSLELGLACKAERLTWKDDEPSQNACRQKREAFFASLLKGSGDRIFYAHHQDDQAETVLLRLIRGTGAKGLRGMLPVSGKKVRPFLALSKETLLAAAREWGLSWREDSSNASLKYERNWVRSLFPLVEARRPGFREKLASLAEEARGWPLAGGIENVFDLSDGVSFSRPTSQTAASVLSDSYRLGRAHANSLKELLEKSAGRAEAEGVRFTWSAGILLAERGGEKFSGQLAPSASGGLRSELGSWSIPPGAALPARGDSCKKAFQAGKVPVFFRGAVPLVKGPRGLPRVLLPEAPSALGAWWLLERERR